MFKNRIKIEKYKQNKKCKYCFRTNLRKQILMVLYNDFVENNLFNASTFLRKFTTILFFFINVYLGKKPAVYFLEML